MKKLLVVTFVLALLASCEIGGGGGPNGPSEPINAPTASFWAADEKDNPYRVTAKKLAENSRCEVWVENNNTKVTQADANRIASEFNNIYTKNIAAFSKPVNIQGYQFADTMAVTYLWFEAVLEKKYSKLTILCLDIKDGYTKDNGSFMSGYFAPRDFYPNEMVIKEYPNLRSNERPMLYMDTYPSLEIYGWPEFYSTITHEMQHLMNCTIDMAKLLDDIERNTDVWVNEGLSAAAEWNYAGHVQQRIDWFANDPVGFIAQGNNFFVWNNYTDQDPDAILDDYATVYLFFQWLRLNGGGTAVYKEIMNSDYGDYQAVVNAASGYSNWQSLLEDWLVANYNPSVSKGYGSDAKLKSEVKFNYCPPDASNGAAADNFPLYPGEAVYSKANSFTVPSGSTYITNRGLTTSGSVVSSGSFTGALLSYNTNTNYEGNAAGGSVTGVANIVASRQVPDSLRGPYAISRSEMLRRRGVTEKKFDLTVINSSKLFKGVLIE